MPVAAFLSIEVGVPSAFLSLPPQEPSAAWVAFSQFRPDLIAVSVSRLPPPAISRLMRVLGSHRACMGLGSARPNPCNAFFASSVDPMSPTAGAAVLTTGLMSVTSSSLSSGILISDIALVLKVLFSEGEAFFCRFCSFTCCFFFCFLLTTVFHKKIKRT